MLQDTYLRWPQVSAISGLSRTTIWRRERAGEFPKRRQLGANSVAWLQSEVSTWVKTRSVVGKTS